MILGDNYDENIKIITKSNIFRNIISSILSDVPLQMTKSILLDKRYDRKEIFDDLDKRLWTYVINKENGALNLSFVFKNTDKILPSESEVSLTISHRDFPFVISNAQNGRGDCLGIYENAEGVAYYFCNVKENSKSSLVVLVDSKSAKQFMQIEKVELNENKKQQADVSL